MALNLDIRQGQLPPRGGNSSSVSYVPNDRGVTRPTASGPARQQYPAPVTTLTHGLRPRSCHAERWPISFIGVGDRLPEFHPSESGEVPDNDRRRLPELDTWESMSQQTQYMSDNPQYAAGSHTWVKALSTKAQDGVFNYPSQSHNPVNTDGTNINTSHHPTPSERMTPLGNGWWGTQGTQNTLLTLVMCGLGLGLKPQALAWLSGAWACTFIEPSPEPKTDKAWARLGLKPGLTVSREEGHRRQTGQMRREAPANLADLLRSKKKIRQRNSLDAYKHAARWFSMTESPYVSWLTVLHAGLEHDGFRDAEEVEDSENDLDRQRDLDLYNDILVNRILRFQEYMDSILRYDALDGLGGEALHPLSASKDWRTDDGAVVKEELFNMIVGMFEDPEL
ncbi:hypothetical protein K435DRAFT_871974 [Dendrothele bispora CBS 962.96]|uniref:Uncharacterized protein n=1 Tax=Dendrothele bispora (strain CBS 962.96) TaxID=1314807 RepID=A0A4S8L2Y5_DENBC|nr:hypothetical protein K435DRAFT_871974 [Dendrothele bispora CBS 962.96]